jgi:hypothetical protein
MSGDEALERRRSAAARYKPAEIDLLLVAEAPPKALDRYLYFEDVPAACRALADAGLPGGDVRIPFPGSGRQLEFVEAFRRALQAEPA